MSAPASGVDARGRLEDSALWRQASGLAIGTLVRANLIPAFAALEGSIGAGDGSRVDLAYGGLIAACNTCHKAAKRPDIHIERRADNPYLQDFAPVP